MLIPIISENALYSGLQRADLMRRFEYEACQQAASEFEAIKGARSLKVPRHGCAKARATCGAPLRDAE